MEFPKEGFDLTALATWSVTFSGYSKISTDCGMYSMVGGSNNFGVGAKIIKTYNYLLPHYAVGVLVDIYKIDSWDSEIFYINLDTQSRQHVYVYTQDPVYARNFCGEGWLDDMQTVYEIFNHSSIKFDLTMTSSLNQAPSDEAWGVNNLQISLFSCHPTCMNCSNNTINDCISCYPDAHITSLNQCICDDGYYSLPYEILCISYPCTLCKPCLISKCQTCSQDDNCFMCFPGYYLTNLNADQQKYLYGTSMCQTYCLGGTYKNEIDRTCDHCDISCNSCIGPTDSDCTSCFDHSILINNKCLACDSNCYTCSLTITNCTNCMSPLFLYDNTCLSNCPIGYYARSNDQTCQKCDVSCSECTDGSIQGCTKCPNNLVLSSTGRCFACDQKCYTCKEIPDLCTSCYTNTYLYFDECISVCPIGKWEDSVNKICADCDSSCYTCFAGTSNSCIQCFSQYYLHNNVCLNCDSNCNNCQTSSTNCSDCTKGMYLYNNKCYSVCPSGFWANITTNKCDLCDKSCLSCSGSGNLQCTSCAAGFYLYSGQCLLCYSNCFTCDKTTTFCTSCSSSTYLYNGNCLSSCPKGYWPNSVNKSCDMCDSSCLTCQSPGTSNDCLTCPIGYYFNSMKCNECAIGCASCNTSTYCTLCFSPFFLSNNTCLDSCQQGFWRDVSNSECKLCDVGCVNCSGPSLIECTACLFNQILINGECQMCDGNCSTCKGLGDYDCLSCAEDFYLEENNCVPVCNIGFFPYLSPSKTCQKCSDSCKTCIAYGDNKCSSCKELQFISITDEINKVGTCYQLCPTNLINDRSNYTCVNSCFNSKYKDILGNECVNCSNFCVTCDGGSYDNCLTCQDTQYILNKTCYDNCPQQYFANSSTKICQPCPKNCLECQNSDKCIKCLSNYYVSNYNLPCDPCQDDGTFININDLSCRNCSYGCSKCISETNCTKCQDPFYLNNISCVERIHVMPYFAQDDNIPFLFNLNFNETWPLFFEKLNTDKNSYQIILENVSIKKYKYTLKLKEFSTNIWEILMNVTVSIENQTHVVLYLFPPNTDSYYNLVKNKLVLEINPYIYCGYLKIYVIKSSNCQNLIVISPQLTLTDNQRVSLSFSSDFEDFFKIIQNVTNIYMENIPRSNYNLTLKTTDSSLRYDILLEFNQSVLNKPLLVVDFELPGYLLYHPVKRLLPLSVSIILGEFIYNAENNDLAFKCQQFLQNYSNSFLLPATVITGLLGSGSISFSGLISLAFIKYLRYLDIDYPLNALAVFEFSFQINYFPKFINSKMDYVDINLPNKFILYNVDKYYLSNVQDEIIILMMSLSVGIFLKFFAMKFFKESNKNLFYKIICKITNIFYLNLTLVLFMIFLIDISFFSLTGIYWSSFKTTKISINFMLAIFIITLIVLILIVLYKILNSFFMEDEIDDFFDEKFKKKESDSTLLSSKLRETDNFLSSKLCSLQTKTTISNFKEFDRSQNFNLIAKSTVKKGSWWKNHVDNIEPKIIKNSTNKSVTFREDIEIFTKKKMTCSPKKNWDYILVLTNNFKSNKMTEKTFILLNLIRCIILPCLLIFFYDKAYWSAYGILFLHIIYFLYMLFNQPFKSNWLFFKNILLELCILTATVGALTLAMGEKNNDADYSTKIQKGWVIFYSDAIALLIVILSFVFTLFSVIWNIIPRRKKKVFPN